MIQYRLQLNHKASGLRLVIHHFDSELIANYVAALLASETGLAGVPRPLNSEFEAEVEAITTNEQS